MKRSVTIGALLTVTLGCGSVWVSPDYYTAYESIDLQEPVRLARVSERNCKDIERVPG